MAIRKSHSAKSARSNRLKAGQRGQAKGRIRQMLLENLEQRQLLAVGPQLIGIQPNNSDLLSNGDIRVESPRELTFRFDDAQLIDQATLAGIRIQSAGGDGTFGLSTAQSDFGSLGKANIQLTAVVPGQQFTVNVTHAVLPVGTPPAIAINGSTISVGLNTNSLSPTKASELVQSLNNSPVLLGRLVARLNGGLGTASLGVSPASTYSPVSVSASQDRVITPGAVIVGANPNENEVTLRFAEILKDDNYRIEIFGFDDPNSGVVGLRNQSGQLFRPTVNGTRLDTVDFRLDLGPQVLSVVPQPVVRVNGQLTQQRDTVVVYFDADKLLVENDGAGRPTNRSVENPAFYQLIFTADTVRNTDDLVFLPQTVNYNAANNTATLKFATDINDLAGSSAGQATYRLRVGTRESMPTPPVRSEAAATAITDMNTSGAVTLRFTARQIGEGGSGVQLNFVNSQSGTPTVTASGRTINVDLGRLNLTAQELVDLLRVSSAASSLVSVDFEPGSNPNAVVGNTNLAFSPVTLYGLGSSFDTATNLGVIGSANQPFTSLILSSAIDPESFILDRPGASDDAAHRDLPQNLLGGFEDHVNQAFGADATNGITTIFYNFRSRYSFDNLGNPLTNAISPDQKLRAREILSLWSKYLGVQFVETSDLGVTIATGAMNGLTQIPGTQLQNEGLFGVRIDPTFQNSLIIMSVSNTWGNNYAESYSRHFAAAVGEVLGLEHAGDLPETTLMRLDPTFLAGSGTLIDPNDAQLNANDEIYEPILPGNQDILHGQYLYRKDGSDIDLYKFEVDFGGQDRVGLLTAETYARRLTNSSSLNTNLELFREIQATATTTMGANLSLRFEAIKPGSQGNQLQIFFTQSEFGDARKPIVMIPPDAPNAIRIDLNATVGLESTVQDVIDAINNKPEARALVKVSLVDGAPTTSVGGNLLTQNPVVLSGGQFELVSQNDDYFNRDSLLRQSLTAGVYYLGVSASGNDDYNAAIPGTGFGGGSQGDYELRITFRAAVDSTDAIQDLMRSNDPSVELDGDGDGIPGGTHDFWFQTRPLNRTLTFISGASTSLEGRTLTVVGANGTTTVFEFSSDGAINPGRTRIPYLSTHTAGDLANAVAGAIASRATLGVGAVANGTRLILSGERSIKLDPLLTIIEIAGKTIFVDKSAGPSADGSLARPFNNISGAGVPNAFAATHPGDIVRIVGNGGADNNITTVGDNFAYEIGAGLLAGSVLSDGSTMDIPKGVTTMIDAGAVFKLRRARIGVGSSDLNIDRSGGALQVLGAPLLLDQQGNALRNPSGGIANGRVFFTSWLDESIGFDTYSPQTSPTPGDWGGISYRRDVDTSAGRRDLENEGIFLQYVNHADIRFGGGTVIVNSAQQNVNPIQMLTTRPTVTDNFITRSASAALSALPNSFEETNFHEPRFQQSGEFTSDYDRVGPELRRNTLLNNSINGLFIRVDMPADGSPQTLTVPGRFDDVDIVHVITDNIVVSGAPGGSILDSTVPPADLISTGPTVGGTLLPGTYSYKLTFVDRNGYESMPSNASASLNLNANQTAISVAGLPTATDDFVERRLYRSQGNGNGPYDLIAVLDRATSTFLDLGRKLGGTLSRDRLNISGTSVTALPTGSLAAGTYNYRVVQLDAGGREGLASNPTANVAVAANGSAHLDALPLTSTGNIGRRIYRSSRGGVAPYVLVGELLDAGNASTTNFTDNGSFSGGTLAAESFGVKRPRLNASLVIDPGMVLKLEAARIEATFGANIIAEGTDGNPITFTSRLDDSIGAGGTFDTNNNGTATQASPRDWGGIYMAPTSTLSLDYAVLTFGGGVTKLDGTFRAFNILELHQAEARIANSLFENNADGFGGQGPGTRFGRLSNQQATIFVRGTQPIIIDNVFRNNIGSVLTIDANSMIDDLKSDSGRQTGAADRDPNYLTNRGPLIRNNRFENNDLNGLEIRGDTLTTASVWDDTDLVHVVFEEIFTGNVQHEGGLRLQSAPNESLVVKFDGYGSNFNRNLGAGLTANGQLTSATDRVGGTLHILGQPGFPVILTSLFDDTVGAGLRPNGQPQTDTNNDGIGSVPQAADWRGILLDQYSNDRNVVMLLETEAFTAAAPGPNGSVGSAQVLGDLASTFSASNENLHLGFVVEGVLSQSADVDTYSFTAAAGTEIWLDVDFTANNLDLVIELLDANGSLLARSDNSTAETADPSLILVSEDLIDRNSVNPLATRTQGVRLTSSGVVKEDGTTNPLDPGMRVRLPGATGARGTYYFRIRSNSTSPDAVDAGLTAGAYQVQVRMREQQEFAGSAVNFADIRYAMNGVHLRGLPGESPLIGEAAEDESVRNGQIYSNNGVATGNGVSSGFFFGNVDRQIGNRPQYVGNLLHTAKGAISVAGNLSSNQDVDFYMLEINQEDLVGSLAGGYASVVFDMDYADGLNRPDTSINIFREESSQFGNQYRLIFSNDSSNIADDQGRPLSITDVEDLSRGSVGTGDAYIGPVALPEGNYLVGVSSAGYQPRTRVISPFDVKPIDSVKRIVDEKFLQGTTGATPPTVQNFLPSTNTGVTGEIVSKTFNLGGYAAADLPAMYVDYTHAGGVFEIFVVESNGAEFAVASSNDPSLLQIQVATGALKVPLNGVQVRTASGAYVQRDFSGRDGLSLVVRGPNTTNLNNVIIGFAERGESISVGTEQILLQQGLIFAPSGNPAPPFAPGSVVSTRQFSLVTYSQFLDRPQIAFDYEVFNGQLDVWAIDDATGQQVWLGTTVAANRPQNVTLLTVGAPLSAVLDISFFSGRSQLRVEFRARNDNPSRTIISNAIIQLADGSRVLSGEANSTYTTVPVSSARILTGNYQLEIRLGEEFFSSRRFGAPLLTKSWDTNDRLAEQITLVAPLGSDLTDGDRFKISDGGRSITFEFSLDANVGLGNVPIQFVATDTNFQVAAKIRDAINNPGVQSRLNVRAASSGGIQTGTTGRDTRVNLHGNASFETISSTKPAGAVQVIFHQGSADRNAQRDQSQIIIQNSFIRESRDYGVWSEPSPRLPDPRDAIDPFSFFSAPLQKKPNLVGTSAVRNLLAPNNSVQGGLLPGLVVQNNVLEEGGLGGIMVQGETPIWMLTPVLVPPTDPNPLVNVANPPSHFGGYIDDGDLLVVDADRTRLKFEFEDLAGGATGNPTAGSGQVEGDGIALDSTTAWYRDTGGSFYDRLTCTNCTPFATTAYETIHAMRDSFLASILVSNGTTHTITATAAESLMGPDPLAPDSVTGSQFYPEYFNRPALYLEGVTNLQWLDTPGGFSNPFDIRQLDLGETPQPHARIVNNTIIGKDGRASFNGETGLNESNDTLEDATQTWQGTAHNPLFYSDVGIIGDGGQNIASLASGSAAGSGSGSGAGGGVGGTNGLANFNPDHLIIRFEAGVSPEQQAQTLSAQGLQVVKRFEFINAVLVRTAPDVDVLMRSGELAALPEINFAEPDYIQQLDRVPNDPLFRQQWHYDNQGQTGGKVDADIDLPEAWDSFTGSPNTVIAIIDSGVDYNHADLRANMWVNPGEIPGDGIDNDRNGYIDDIYGIDTGSGDSDPQDTDGHGTHVAGTTAAVGNNGTGVTGVSWNSKIMAIKATDASGGLPQSATIEALNYLVTMKTRYGINIVVSNNSYGGGGFSQASMAAIQASINVGIPFVTSAGNNGLDNDAIGHFPSNYPLDGIIAVAATDHNDRMANFSNFGLTTVDVAAPGVDVLSTTLGGGYGLNSGTSMASPHVAGVVALLAGAVPSATVTQLKTAIVLGADAVPSLDGTSVTGARLNAAKSLLVINAGLGATSNTDVDIYQFKLGVGERAIIDIDTANSGLDAVLQIFDSRGIAQSFVNANGAVLLASDNDAAPGEPLELDPYADFTATAPGVYYAAVSSVGNTVYDPLSFANRQAGTTTGAYRIVISARHLQNFVITAQDASAYSAGDTFTIFGVPDIGTTGTSGRTFEFVIGLGGPSNPNNIPININANWRFPDVANAIARAVNEGGPGRGRALPNTQVLPNGQFGFASPLPPVHARALGGLAAVLDANFNGLEGDKAFILEQLGAVNELGTNKVSQRELERQLSGTYYEVNQGLELFTRRPDGFITFTTTTLGGVGSFLNVTSLSNLGIGHDRESTTPISFTSRGDGASEKFVVINNAAWIDGNNTIIVDPDQNADNNLDQLLPETGVLATRGASPTILNNVFFNLQSPVINEESRVNANTFVYAPYGTDNPNIVSKPGKVVVGGSIYQYYEPGIANVRFGTGIEKGPTNVPNTQLDSNFDVANGVRLFVNAQAGQYLPAAGSPLIDSSIDTLPERSEFAATKSAMGLALSPVVSPDFDLVGQLRADDPAVSPPGGQGQNVFKDRGAFERADFIGPTAILLDPIDNDALGIDQDRADSVVQLLGGVYPEFRIQLADGNEPANPLRGLGIDDNTVVNSEIPGRRLTGASVVVFENGRLLQEGIDYTFSYNATRDEIVLTPLAGVWKNDRVYEISINNKDRFAVIAPSGDQVVDGGTFSITDSRGGQVVYEFDSGYRIQVPQGLSMLIPLAGGAFGGIADGDRFSIISGTTTRTFEFDRNGNTLGGNIAIPFQLGDSQAKMTDAVVAAINAANLGVSPVRLNNGTVFLGALAGVRLDTTFTTIDQPSTTLALKIPDLGPRPGGITEGQTFTVSDGRKTVTFEYDLDGRVSPGNTALDFSGTSTADELTTVTLAALNNSGLSISPKIVSPRLIYVGLSPNGSVSTGNSLLGLLGVSRSLSDGQTFVVSGSGGTATFEFSTDAVVASGNIRIPIALVDTQGQIADRIAAAITAAGLGLQPVSVGDGNIAVGGSPTDTINLAGAPSLTLFGKPGIQSSTRLELFGPLILTAPARGASDLVENGTFTINDGTRTATFEFDGNFSGPSAPGNVVIRFNSLSTASSIANEMVLAILSSGLAITPTNLGNGAVALGQLQTNQVNVGNSNLTLKRGVIGDGETFTINNGVRSVTFEFDNVDIGNGFSLSNSPILFGAASTPDSVAQSMKAVIEGAGLGLTTTVFPGGIIQLNDTPRYVTDTRGAPTLVKTGVPGGANAVSFIQDPSFDGEDMRKAIIQAINRTANTSLVASNRGANTLFVENAISISSELDSFFVRGVADQAGNLLKPNRINDETAFTILMPGVTLDYGDAPDPLSTTFGRYATQHANDGARHVVGNNVLLGASISAETNGQPSANADRDSNDNGVVFGTNLFNPNLVNNGAGLFNRNVFTSIDVTVSSPGFVDGWIDFNADGDWDDPGEQILTSVEFTDRTLTQTFQVTVPATAPILSSPTKSYARFRSSSAGQLAPSGLAVDGEVEDYAVTIAPGNPPTAVNDNYVLNEDSSLVTTDADGTLTPSFTIDDGFAANDVDPEGGPFGISIVDPPSVGTLLLDNPANPRGTFSYTPPANFNGDVTFTYRVNDGILNSNNLGTVTLRVREVNDAPSAQNDQFVTSEDVVLVLNQSAVLQNDSTGPNEPEQTLVVSAVSPVSKFGGTVTLSGGVISYTPPANYSGPDEFVYTATDNGTTGGVAAPRSASATVFLTVRDKNDAPITGPDFLTTNEDTPVTVSAALLISNDLPGPADESSQSIQFVRVLPTSTNGGTVTRSGDQVTYTPPADFVGTDTFFYEIEDNGLSEGVADPQKSLGTVTVDIIAVNDAPRVRTPFGTVVMLEDGPTRIINLSDIFFDPDVFTNNDRLTYQIVSNSNTTLVSPSINGGQLELQLLPDQNGQSLIVVRATDGANVSVTDTLTLQVTPVNDAPRLREALPDLNVDEDSPPIQLVLSPTYFFDPDVVLNGDQLTFAVISNSNPLLVTPVISGSTLQMTLIANQSGVAVLAISATDKSGQTITDTFNLVVNPVNDVPETTADSYRVRQGETLRTTDPRGLVGGTQDDGVLANDRDPEGSPITAILVTAPKSASQFFLNDDGTFTYVHDFLKKRTPDTFTYRASDGVGQSVVTTVTIEIDAPPPPVHQNPIQNMDVNADGFVSPIDALLVINFLNNNSGSGSVVGLPPPPPFRDVNGDNFITAIDALLIINSLNSARFGGEGEAFGSIDSLAAFAAPEIASHSVGNRHIGMRQIDVAEGLVYGPVISSNRSQIFSQFGQVENASSVDISWFENREDAMGEDREIPVDLALASWLGDLDDNGDV